MRSKKVLFVLVVVAVVSLAVLSVKAWQSDKIRAEVKRHATEISKRAEAESSQRKEQTRERAEDTEKKKLKEQCQIGLEAYEALTPTEQLKVQKPQCDLKQVQ